MKNYRFRPATSDDVPRILQIIAQAQRRMAAAGSGQWQNGYPALGNIVSDLGRGYGHVLCRAAGSGACGQRASDAGRTDSETVVAYGAIVFDGEPAYDALDGQWLTAGPYVVVHRLAVSDEALGQGLGRAFLQQTERLAREQGVGAFRIDTNFDNRRMLHILASEGFVCCGKIRYESGERLAFEKRLGGITERG